MGLINPIGSGLSGLGLGAFKNGLSDQSPSFIWVLYGADRVVWQYLLKRLFHLLPVTLGVSIITFGLINLAPGDPAELICGPAGWNLPRKR